MSSKMILFVLVTCRIGIVAAADDDKDQDKESLGVSEGENLTISIHIEKSDEDPQVLVTRLKGSLEEPIAQLICHNEDCKREEDSGVSLIYDGDGGNVMLILLNVSFSQAGLYTVSKLSGTQPKNKIYNVTVYPGERNSKKCLEQLEEPVYTTRNPETQPHTGEALSTGAKVAVGIIGAILALVVLVIALVIADFITARRAGRDAITAKAFVSLRRMFCHREQNQQVEDPREMNTLVPNPNEV
ncbi:uncharacterized protein LOC143725548 isoform X1 [Siphateles boraxobius]|uniref:uncharacterized protein LOC143725548 isoform X1 n=1 Tax=Siphateles boraxobius TaxID=180520 RepID=UPI004064C5E3